MEIVGTTGREHIATVHIADMGRDKLVEFVESIQPPITRDKKWVLIVSVLYGCPVGCLMCDAGDDYRGRLSKEEMFGQIDYLVRRRFPDGRVPVEKFKIQFARMGEPALNPAVLDVLEEIQDRYDVPGFIPSVSTVAPRGTEPFFEKLFDLKQRKYAGGRFQLQFSIHTTDRRLRDKIVPVKKWSFSQIARYGESFVRKGDKKIALNFALALNAPLDVETFSHYFDAGKFLVKITPINPTYRAEHNRLISVVDACSGSRDYGVIRQLESAGYDVILSIGEAEENLIGSNCGQYVLRHLRAKGTAAKLERNGYDYWP